MCRSFFCRDAPAGNTLRTPAIIVRILIVPGNELPVMGNDTWVVPYESVWDKSGNLTHCYFVFFRYNG